MRLETSRLLLRDFREDDWRATHAYESDPEVVRYQSFGPRTPEESQDYIARNLADLGQEPRWTYDLAVVLREEEHLVGRCGLHVSDPALREGVLWYILHRQYWGRGIMVEAARALLSFGFNELKLHRVWADTDPRNLPSIRILEKLGMRREAHFRENGYYKGEWTDSFIYALLAREWPHASAEARAR
jgi:[ribosomal protein S5]-alanine N-acetyltransferase